MNIQSLTRNIDNFDKKLNKLRKVLDDKKNVLKQLKDRNESDGSADTSEDDIKDGDGDIGDSMVGGGNDKSILSSKASDLFVYVMEKFYNSANDKYKQLQKMFDETMERCIQLGDYLDVKYDINDDNDGGKKFNYMKILLEFSQQVTKVLSNIALKEKKERLDKMKQEKQRERKEKMRQNKILRKQQAAAQRVVSASDTRGFEQSLRDTKLRRTQPSKGSQHPRGQMKFGNIQRAKASNPSIHTPHESKMDSRVRHRGMSLADEVKGD